MASAQQERSVRARRKVLVGRVTSNQMTKTIVVQITRKIRHPKYSRVLTQASRFKAHDETNSAGIGDWVKIAETRPLSKDKRWRLVEILKRASSAPPIPAAEVEQPKPVASQDAPAPQEVGG